MPKKDSYTNIQLLKVLFKTVMTSVYCFAARPDVQRWMYIIGSI